MTRPPPTAESGPRPDDQPRGARQTASGRSIFPTTRPHRRRPLAVYRTGDEPDPRFSLANERTLLAWVRTSLALLAGGLGLHLLATQTADPLWSRLSLTLLLGGAVLPAFAWYRWSSTERGMRRGEPLPGGGSLLPVVACIAVVAVLCLVEILIG